MPRGKDAEWTPEQKAQAQNYICEQMALGRSLAKICQEPEMPNYSTVFDWRNDDEVFANNYARAREDQADHHADAIVDIADNEPDPAKARNRIDARKWAAGKLKPKIYGERLHLDADVTVKMSDEQLEHRIAHLFGKERAIAAPGGAGETEGAA